MYFAQIFYQDDAGRVVWEGPVESEDAAERKMREQEAVLGVILDLEYWLITPEELADWAKSVQAKIVDYTGEFPDLPQGKLRRMK
jgi:hypothetical protein